MVFSFVALKCHVHHTDCLKIYSKTVCDNMCVKESEIKKVFHSIYHIGHVWVRVRWESGKVQCSACPPRFSSITWSVWKINPNISISQRYHSSLSVQRSIRSPLMPYSFGYRQSEQSLGREMNVWVCWPLKSHTSHLHFLYQIYTECDFFAYIFWFVSQWQY